MEERFAGNAYRHFLVWGIFTALTVTLCTIIDSLFIGNLIGSHGLAVTSLSTPVFLLYSLLGLTIGVGANVHIGRMLGSSDVKGANRLFHSQLSIGLLVGMIALSPVFFKDAYFAMLGVTEELYPLAQEYLTVVMWSAPIFVMYHVLSVSVRTDSDPKLSTIASFVVIVTNMTLDLLFMQVLNTGIIGASASLCIAETLGVLVLLTHFLKKEKLLTLRLGLPKLSDVKSFVYNGFGVGSANIFIAVVMRVFNAFLLHYGGEMGTEYVGIYGVIYTISMIPIGVFEGTSNALSTVTAFFAGESDEKGIFAVFKKAISVAAVWGGIVALLCAVFSDALVWFFGIKDAASIECATVAMRIFAFSVIFTGINTVITVFWQSIGRAKLASAMSVIRNCLLLLLFGVLFMPGLNIIGLSISYVCTEIVCTLVSLLVLAFSPSKKYVSEKYRLKGKSFERSYLIETESMTQISGDLETLCEEWDIGMKQSFFINFVCEELLLNIIKFSLDEQNKKNKSYYVSIKLMEKDGDYILRIRDNVSLYNPFESQGDEIDSGVLKLIRKKTKYCDYQRKMIFNYLYMVI